MARRKVVYVADGKDAATVKEFADFLEAHGGKREAVTDASIDMGAAFEAGIKANFPNAAITFDKFCPEAPAARSPTAGRIKCVFRYSAPTGKHDDLAMALALASFGLRRVGGNRRRLGPRRPPPNVAAWT
jgi:hypothetical protein